MDNPNSIVGVIFFSEYLISMLNPVFGGSAMNFDAGSEVNGLEFPVNFKGYILRTVCVDDIENVYVMRKKVAAESDTILSAPDEITLEGMSSWVKNWLSISNRLFVVVEHGNEIVGQLWVWFLDSKKKTAHVAEFGMEIVAEHRGNGIGSKLTELAIEWARNNNAVRIEAETLEKNIPMRKILEKFGFELEGTKKCYLRNRDSYENTVIYGKILDVSKCIDENFQE